MSEPIGWVVVFWRQGGTKKISTATIYESKEAALGSRYGGSPEHTVHPVGEVPS